MSEQKLTEQERSLTIGRVTNDDLEAAVAVWFKDEDEVLGGAVGPVWIQIGGTKPDADTNPMPRDYERLHPFHRPDDLEWWSVYYAERLADDLGVPLVRS